MEYTIQQLPFNISNRLTTSIRYKRIVFLVQTKQEMNDKINEQASGTATDWIAFTIHPTGDDIT